ncbi:MAG: hypothetical protein K4571_10420 [Deltaproteobacteria bacterium]
MNLPPAISRFVAVSLGMDEDAAGKGAVNRAVASAMRQEGFSDVQAYAKLFASSPDARQKLIDAMVVGETWFFRDRGPFTYLARHARELQNARSGGVLNILSAPCATGEEPYSIAMTLLAAGLPPSAFRVDGVDISQSALARARKACYGSGAFRGNIGEDVAGFFETTSHGRQVVSPVVRQVTFYHDNLVSPGGLAGRGPYAIIFCRNLLIYLIPEARRRVFELLDRLLLPGGLLFTGHTETIFWHQQGYLPLQWDRAFALSKPAISPPKSAKKTTALKSTPPAAVRPCGLTAPAANPASPGKTFAAQSPMPAAGEKQKPVKPRAAAAGLNNSAGHEELQEARQLADRGNVTEALRLCEDYIRIFGPAAEAYGLMGVIRMAGHELDAAEDLFLKALYLDPGHYESLVHISLIYRQKGNEKKTDLFRERARRQADRQEKTREAPEKRSLTKADENVRIK